MPAGCVLRWRARCRARRTTARAGAIRSARCADTTHTAVRPRRRRRASVAGARQRPGASAWRARHPSASRRSIRQQRILADPLREHSLGKTRHEHDAERSAARRRRRADEHAAVAAARRLVRQRRQPRRQHIAHFAQASPDRPPTAAPARAARERRARAWRSRAAPAARARVSHVAPRLRRAASPPFPTRTGSANERSARSCSRSRISARTRDASGSSELASRTRRSYSCSRPFRRRCQRSSLPITAASTIRSSHRHGARNVPARSRSDSPRATCAAGFLLRLHILGALIERQHRFDDLVGRRRPAVGVAGFGERHLAERDVFGESPRRQLLVRAGQQREQRAARRIGATGAAMKPGGNAGALERVFEHAEIGLRRAQQDRHLIERHAARGFLHQASRDLDRLSAFAGRREQHHGIVRARLQAAARRRTDTAAASQVRVPQVRGVRGVLSARCSSAPVSRVAGRNRRDRPICAAAITALMNAASDFDPIAMSSSTTVLSASRCAIRLQLRRSPSRASSRNRPRRRAAALRSRARAARRDRRWPRARSAATDRAPAMRSSRERSAERARKTGHLRDRREYLSASFVISSWVTRAETASSLSGALGVSPCRASAGTARRATSSATLDRVMPNVAPFVFAIENANSSAAARVAAITRIGGSISSTRRRAPSRRAARPTATRSK